MLPFGAGDEFGLGEAVAAPYGTDQLVALPAFTGRWGWVEGGGHGVGVARWLRRGGGGWGFGDGGFCVRGGFGRVEDGAGSEVAGLGGWFVVLFSCTSFFFVGGFEGGDV